MASVTSAALCSWDSQGEHSGPVFKDPGGLGSLVRTQQCVVESVPPEPWAEPLPGAEWTASQARVLNASTDTAGGFHDPEHDACAGFCCNRAHRWVVVSRVGGHSRAKERLATALKKRPDDTKLVELRGRSVQYARLSACLQLVG